MKIQTYTDHPRLKTFIKLFGFNLGLMLIPVVACYLIFDFGSPVKDYLQSVGLLFALYPSINAIVGTYTARKQTFTITAIDDPALVAGWVVAVLQKNGMRIVAEQVEEVMLESTNWYLKWFAIWFGPGLTTVNYNSSSVTITGSIKSVDIIGTKIKFGRVDFNEQPYKHS
ncbi:hypothetical protein JAO76_00940 [Pontibacter sp. BT310]|uniref:DUF304 domain-containing protein n=1 Tax=Pontibacter populi TaxID=890055 RepID=A0ABS6X6G9_9BACT|nr:MULTISPECIES: hypothetical protein [Pontibacter]MBJ6116735.1 hypothetical protein [Pontibacter sp. BT310]MBR0569159.1 hypothetical protein [Microvirga sp. STS03]MBW3363589.1 hypothetical protein [Pontibacter populi]